MRLFPSRGSVGKLKRMKRLIMLIVLGGALATAAVAQQGSNSQSPANSAGSAAKKPPAADTAPAPAATPGAERSAEEVLNDLLKRRAENPLIEPSRPEAAVPATAPAVPGVPGVPGAVPAGQPMGTAPAIGAAGTLRREGAFVINRRARMVRVPGEGLPWMVVFDADATGLADPPMYLMPCQMLERVESLAQQHGDAAVFLVSGEVYVYRGANYLLPTIMRLTQDRGNLNP